MSKTPDTRAFVPGFANDLFISYGHIDNRSSQWVEKLHLRLRDRLAELLGGEISIWRDLKLNGADLFWDVIREEISRSAVFLSVLSPRYISSDSCRQEADWFVECVKRSDKPAVNGIARLIKVIKTPYDQEEPASLREFNTLGFHFYDKPDDQTQSYPAEYAADKDLDPLGYQKFYKESDRLARALADLLRALAQTSQAVRPASNQKGVYVAFATSDRAEHRQRLINELRSKRYRVLPNDEHAPSTKQDLEAILKRDLPCCSLAVHEMGYYYGLVPEGDSEQRSLAQLQYEIVRQQTSLRQKVYIPDLEGVEKKQSEFLASIEATGDERCEFVVKQSYSSFVGGILDELAKPEIRERNQAKSIFLMYDKNDLDKPMRMSVFKHLISLGYPVMLPAFQGEGKMIRKLEEKNIRNAAGTLIYYGAATDSWVQMKRQTLLKVLAGSEERGKHVRGLYLSAPADEFKRNTYLEFSGNTLPEGTGLSPLLILGACQEQFSPDELRDFLRNLERDLPC
jgi:TIR domain